jgi:hypothetical protein
MLRKIIMCAGRVKRRLKIYRSFGFLGYVDKRNLTYRERTPLSDSMRSNLIEYFSEDVTRLSTLLNRDLSHWQE